MGELGDVAEQLVEAFTPDESLSHALGQAGRRASFDQLERDAGSDRRMSGMKPKLAAGYDTQTDGAAILNLRPKGLWTLLSDGRQRSGTIRPTRRGRKRAVSTPQGPRASSTFRRSRGSGTLDRLERTLPTVVESTIGDHFARRINRVK